MQDTEREQECAALHDFGLAVQLLGEHRARCPCVASIVQADGAVLQQDNEILF